MINVFILTNINTKIIEGKLSKIIFSEVCIKLVVLHNNRYTRYSSRVSKRLVAPELDLVNHEIPYDTVMKS